MARQVRTISKNNTSLWYDGVSVVMSLHGSTLAYIAVDGSSVTLTDAGYQTVTTQTRLNQLCNELGLQIRYTRAADGQGFGSNAHKLTDATEHNTYNWRHRHVVELEPHGAYRRGIAANLLDLCRRWNKSLGEAVAVAQKVGSARCP